MPTPPAALTALYAWARKGRNGDANVSKSAVVVKFSAVSVEVVHWNPSKPVLPGALGRLSASWTRPVNNFGDLLGPILVDRLLEHFGLNTGESSTSARLVAVGSIMKLTRPNDVVWGAGINGKSMSVGAGRHLDVRAVRGPLTRDLLLSAGAAVPQVYGDPALLWSKFWPRDFYTGGPTSELSPYAVVPNFHDWAAWRREKHAINPRQQPHHVIRQIARSEFVCGSSLHGVIIAESFGIPARLIVSSTEPEFKYSDYYRGTGRPTFKPARSLDEALEMGGEPSPEWDDWSLLKAFPIDLWQGPFAARNWQDTTYGR